MMEQSPKIAAFFDLDRTLLRVNSVRKWVEYERQHGRVGRGTMVRAAFWLLCYKFGVVGMETAIAEAVAKLKGVPEALIAERTSDWYESHIVQTILPAARDAVEAHRAEGHLLVLLTSSSPYISEKIQRDLMLDSYLCTRFEVRDGMFTGAPVLPICYGAGKVILARAWAEERQVDLAHSYFYTDSLTDLPMLEAVGNPRVVNPDPRLRRLAQRRGWQVSDWDVPDSVWMRRRGTQPAGT